MLEFNFEIYTCNPETFETGWDIKFVSVFAEDKADAKEKLKDFPLFDCIILFNFGGCELDEEELNLLNNGVKYFVRHSYMNNTIIETYN